MGIIFTTSDPRKYKISCTEERWGHILSSHAFMESELESLIKTIEDPYTIYQSEEYNNRDVYFGPYKNPPSEKYYTKAIVEIDETTKTGNIVTAFIKPSISGNILETGLKYVKLQPKL